MTNKQTRFRYKSETKSRSKLPDPQPQKWRVLVFTQSDIFKNSFASSISQETFSGYIIDSEFFNDPTDFLRAVLNSENKSVIHFSTAGLEEYEAIGILNTIRNTESGSKIFTVVWCDNPWDDLSLKFLQSGMVNDFQALVNMETNRLVSILYSNIKNQEQFIELEDLKNNLEEKVYNRTSLLSEANIMLNEALDNNRKVTTELEANKQKIELQNNEIQKRNAELEAAFKHSSAQHIKLQKALNQNEQQRAVLEKALEEIQMKNDDLHSRNEEIISQRDHIERQHDKILDQQQEIKDNLIYSSRIQEALLPPKELMTQLLPEHFVLNLPKDVVSGDFYWISQNRYKTIIAVADCTGHGISGAMMSMLGTAFLNEIVNNNDITQSAKILEQLRQRVISSLHQDITDNIDYSRDGMDISICILDIVDNTLEFSGAYNPLYLFRDKELMELRPDKMPIGIHEFYNESFNSQIIDLKSGDTIYLFSDGYPDQFGGIRGKKLKYVNFKNILKQLNEIPYPERLKSIEETFIRWRGENEQIDDVLVLGFNIQ